MSSIEQHERTIRKATQWMKTVTHFAHTHSKDPNTKVAAAILRPDWSLVSMGYNGFPMGTPDRKETWENRGVKYDFVVHAESNAIDFAHQDLHGCTLICNLYPCHICAQRIAQNGIARVFYSADMRDDLKWKVAGEIMMNANVIVIKIPGIVRINNEIEYKGAPWDAVL